MTDVLRLGELIIARLIAAVPDLGGRVYDKAAADTAYPYATLGPIYGTEADAEGIEADDWTVQIDLWDRRTKLDMAALAATVRRALKGWADIDEVTMHPLQVGTPRVMDDPDGQTVHGVLLVEVLLEADPTAA
ncbi:MAG: DUF3168 domain-containing protein [Pseudomonadota bacterium]|nr:DUF3168 domain-containing protein [Pseudomonadota bacterium]